MPIAKASSSEPAPAGTHVARCYGCISLGTQHSEMFADQFKVMLLFELPYERMPGFEPGQPDRPMVISKEYSLSLGKKATLRKHLDSWRGRPFNEQELQGFEVSAVVGAPCQVTVVHTPKQDGGIYAKIESIVGLPKGMAVPKQENPSIKYEITQGQDEAFKSLPEWIRNKILKCEEWAPKVAAPGSAPTPAPAAVDVSNNTAGDDDVPF